MLVENHLGAVYDNVHFALVITKTSAHTLRIYVRCHCQATIRQQLRPQGPR